MKKLFTLCVIVACGVSQENNLNEESYKLHKEALEKGKSAKEKISLIEAEIRLETESAFIDSLASLQKALEDWNKSIVEVPGYGHAHHNHDEHDHAHEALPDLTPEMVFEIQYTIKQKAEALNKKAEQLLKAIKEGDVKKPFEVD